MFLCNFLQYNNRYAVNKHAALKDRRISFLEVLSNNVCQPIKAFFSHLIIRRLSELRLIISLLIRVLRDLRG